MYVRLACWTGYLRQGGFNSVQFFDGPVGLIGVIRSSKYPGSTDVERTNLVDSFLKGRESLH